MISKTFALLLAVPMIVSGCATAPKTFYANPASVKDTTLCRTFLDAAEKGQEQYARDLGAEARRRGLTLEQCQSKVNTENAVLIGIAVVATGAAAVAACSGGGCGGGGYSSYQTDYDCEGGGGDGPYFVKGPFRLTGPDTYDLDRDGDGIACEPFQDMGA